MNNNIIRPKEPIIETERLILRPFCTADAEATLKWTSDERVNKFLSYTAYNDINIARQWISSLYDENNDYTWGIVLKENGVLIGSAEIGDGIEIEGYWGIGYNICYEYWNMGFTTEAMKAIIDYAHKHLGVNKIYGIHAVDNPASGRVMEKCGLKFRYFAEHSFHNGSDMFKVKVHTLEFD